MKEHEAYVRKEEYLEKVKPKRGISIDRQQPSVSLEILTSYPGVVPPSFWVLGALGGARPIFNEYPGH